MYYNIDTMHLKCLKAYDTHKVLKTEVSLKETAKNSNIKVFFSKVRQEADRNDTSHASFYYF